MFFYFLCRLLLKKPDKNFNFKIRACYLLSVLFSALIFLGKFFRLYYKVTVSLYGGFKETVLATLKTFSLMVFYRLLALFESNYFSIFYLKNRHFIFSISFVVIVFLFAYFLLQRQKKGSLKEKICLFFLMTAIVLTTVFGGNSGAEILEKLSLIFSIVYLMSSIMVICCNLKSVELKRFSGKIVFAVDIVALVWFLAILLVRFMVFL